MRRVSWGSLTVRFLMARTDRITQLFKFLDRSPLWVGPLLAVGAFAVLTWGVPWWFRPTADAELPSPAVETSDGRIDMGALTSHMLAAKEKGEASVWVEIAPRFAPHAFWVIVAVSGVVTLRRFFGLGLQSGISCPNCGAPMISRVARRGAYEGETFYGCTRFPSCRGKRSIA